MYQHAWEVSPKEAIVIQQQLRSKVITEDRLGPIYLVAGVDAGSVEGGRLARAAVAVLAYPELALCNHVIAETAIDYVMACLYHLKVLYRLAQKRQRWGCDNRAKVGKSNIDGHRRVINARVSDDTEKFVKTRPRDRPWTYPLRQFSQEFNSPAMILACGDLSIDKHIGHESDPA
jgi:hypothetical protein